MGFHAKTKPPRSGNSEGVLVLVLTALTHQAVKPLAEIVCYYFCCDSLEKRDKIIHMGFHLLSTCCEAEKGRSASITQALTQYNKKPPGTANTGGFLLVLTALLRTPQFLHCRAAAHHCAGTSFVPQEQHHCAAHHSIHHRGFAFSMIHREFGKLSAIQQKNVQNVQSLPSWQSLKSSCFRQNSSVCQIIQVIITLESAKAGKLRCCQRQLLILITVIGNHVLFLPV